MTDIQRKHTIEVIILVMLLIIGGLLVSRIPAQTVKSTPPSHIDGVKGKPAPIVRPVLHTPDPCEPPNWWTADGRCHMKLTILGGKCYVKQQGRMAVVECSWRPK